MPPAPLPTSAPALLLALLGLAALVGLLGGLWLARFLRRARLRRLAERGRAAEADAALLLADRGYRVIGEQVAQRYAMLVDGALREIAVRADLLVERRGRRYIVEVKTGQAAELATAATRRQLLEYAHAFAEADGLLLADMTAGRVQRIAFPRQRPGRLLLVAALLLVLCGAALGAAATLWAVGR